MFLSNLPATRLNSAICAASPAALTRSPVSTTNAGFRRLAVAAVSALRVAAIFALRDLERYDEALACFDKAVALKPQADEALALCPTIEASIVVRRTGSRKRRSSTKKYPPDPPPLRLNATTPWPDGPKGAQPT